MDDSKQLDNQTENEIVLDPDIGEIIEPNQDAGEQGTDQPVQNTAQPDFEPEPMAPIMPEIPRVEYRPLEPETGTKGIKVFAVIVAVLVLISACVTGGYYLGKSQTGSSSAKVDLASKPSAQNAKSTSEIYQSVSPSIVGIYVYNSSGIASSATGVIYSEDGYVVTNDHIYDEVASAKFKVYTNDGKMYSASFVAGDTRSDLAVLKMQNASGLAKATFGNSDELVIGETVVAVGRPNGATQPANASEGIVSSVNRRLSITSSYTGKYIQTDSAINPGSSGGALCNLYGQVVGITSAKQVGTEYDSVGFAIPTTTMKKVVDSLIQNKVVKGRAKLGISYLQLDALSAEISNLPIGLKIASIDKSSDLYGKTVKVNDIITHVNGKQITDSNIILDIIDTLKPNNTVTLTVYQTDKKSSIDITVRLLEDAGGSSYSADASSKEADSKDEYNQSEFSFPNGN